MTPISQTLQRRREIETRDPSRFAEYVRKTSELIGRSYMQTFKITEGWAQWKIEERYKRALESSNPQKYWWGMRKNDKSRAT